MSLLVFQEQAGWIEKKDNAESSAATKKNTLRISVLVKSYLNSSIGIEFQLAKLYLNSRSPENPDDANMFVKDFAEKYFKL